jgi:hypothetical protein
MSPQRRATFLLAAAALWTAGVWGSRIRLMTEDEVADWTNLARIVSSLAFAIALGILAVRVHRTGRSGAPGLLAGFSILMVIVWIPSLLSVAAGDYAPAFKAVHAGLAVISIAFGAATAGQARRERNLRSTQHRELGTAARKTDSPAETTSSRQS